MGRKKNDEVWDHFSKNAGGIECDYCKHQYKSENVTKMRKHLISCLHCPVNVQKSLDRKSTVKTNSIADLTIDTTESPQSPAPSQNSPSLLHDSRSSTPQSSRPSTPNFLKPFVDRMSDKENVSFIFFHFKLSKCLIELMFTICFLFFSG